MVRAEGASAMSRCLATWDRTSGMSKGQWKATCKRVVKENPGLYANPSDHARKSLGYRKIPKAKAGSRSGCNQEIGRDVATARGCLALHGCRGSRDAGYPLLGAAGVCSSIAPVGREPFRSR